MRSARQAAFETDQDRNPAPEKSQRTYPADDSGPRRRRTRRSEDQTDDPEVTIDKLLNT
jgi:hypothetical protein